MWLCFNDGFVSVVADKVDRDRLLVRARRRKDLVHALKGCSKLTTSKIIKTPPPGRLSVAGWSGAARFR